MRMTVRQISDLLEGEVVGERKYCDDPPTEITGVLRLILRNCSDYMKREGITINQDTIELEKLTLRYQGMAGVIEVIVGSEKRHSPCAQCSHPPG